MKFIGLMLIVIVFDDAAIAYVIAELDGAVIWPSFVVAVTDIVETWVTDIVAVATVVDYIGRDKLTRCY